MGFNEIVKNIGKFIESKKQQRLDIPDDQTTDKVLRGLRRQRRVQLEEVEKIRLKKAIANHERKRTSQNVFGVSGKTILNPQGKFMEKLKKEKYMFRDDKPMLKSKNKLL